MPTDLREARDLAVPVPAVFATLQDRSHWERRAALSPEAGLIVEHLGVEGDVLEVRLAGDVPMSWLPSAVRRRLPGVPAIRRIERWRLATGDQLVGDLVFEIDGVSATVSGSGHVAAAASGSRISIDLQIAVHVPFVGGLVEQAIASQVGPSLARELALIDEARAT